jgi:hypothetical protein
VFCGVVEVRKTKAMRRQELAERIAEGASVTVLESQAKPTAVTEQMKEEYVSGWFAGANGECPAGVMGDEFESGLGDGKRYRTRKALGLERYAGPKWEKTLEMIKARVS